MKFIRIFLLVLIVIGVGLLLTQNIWVTKLVAMILQDQETVQQMSPEVSPQATSSTQVLLLKSTPSEEVPTDWETYANETYGFEVKYPMNLFLSTSTTDNFNTVQIFKASFNEGDFSGAREFGGVGFSVRIENVSGNFQDHIDAVIKSGVENSNLTFFCDSTISDIARSNLKINGISAVSLEGFCGPSGKSIYLEKNNKLFTVDSTSLDNDLFSQILSTFKFF